LIDCKYTWSLLLNILIKNIHF